MTTSAIDPRVPRLPDKPHPAECCHRGCCPCIFDYYWDAMDRWEARVEELGLDPKQVLESMGRSETR